MGFGIKTVMKTDLEEIKSRLDIVEVISDYIPLKKAGQNWKGLCPFHSEKTPSFTVSPSKQIYYCFGCSSGGDIFTFLMKYESLSFQESLNILAKRAGVQLNKSPGYARDAGERETLTGLHSDANLFFRKCLGNSTEAMTYLGKRGVTNDAGRLFSIGYAPDKWDALFKHLRDKNYKAEMVKKAGLAVHGDRGYHDTFRNRIIFPIFDLRGEVIAFGGRVMDSSQPKYLNSPETPIFNKSGILFGLNLAKESIKKRGAAILVEGYLDVITVHMHGFSNAVAPLGTAVTREHGKLIKRFAGDVVIVFDGDAPGLKAAKNGISVLLENGLNVKVLALPAGEDPDSFLKKDGGEAFADLLEKAMSVVDFFVMQDGTDERRKKDEHVVVHEALEAIAKIPDSGLQGHYVKQLSEKTNINEFFIMEQLMKVRKKAQLKGEDNRKEAGLSPALKSSGRPMDEVYLMQALFQSPEKSKHILETVSEHDLEDPVIRSVFKKIKSGTDSSGGGLIRYDALIAECDEAEKNFITGLLCRDNLENPEKVFEDCVKRLKSKKRQTLLHELQHKIKRAETEKNDSLLRTLLQEKQRQLKLKG